MSPIAGVKRGPYRPRTGSVGTEPEATCRKCGERKPLEQFMKDAARKHGIHPYCGECQRVAGRAKHAERSPEQRDRDRQRLRVLYERNRKQFIARAADWARQHPTRRREIERGWIAANPERVKLQSARRNTARRGRLANAETGPIDFARIIERDRNRCHICGRRIASSDLSFDHVIPLAKGGSHTEANIRIAHKRCNCSKGAKVLTLF